MERQMSVRSEKLGLVRDRIARGEYRVDSLRVAEAMLQRIGAMALDREITSRDGHDRRPEPGDRLTV